MKTLRPILTVLLLTFFVGSISGFQLYAHYCGDLLAELSLMVSNHCEDETTHCETEEAMECCLEEQDCDDEAYFVQLDIDLQTPKVLEFSFDLEALNVEHVLEIPVDKIVEESDVHNYVSPPLNYKVPIYKSLSRLTFYG